MRKKIPPAACLTKDYVRGGRVFHSGAPDMLY